jgi:large subunit ribosomal protein L34
MVHLTYNPSKLVRKRRHGFFSRKLSDTGILNNRRRKGRKRLCA